MSGPLWGHRSCVAFSLRRRFKSRTLLRLRGRAGTHRRHMHTPCSRARRRRPRRAWRARGSCLFAASAISAVTRARSAASSPAKRLVEQQHRRVIRQRPRDGHALLHAAGECRGVLVARIRQLQPLEPRQRLRHGLRPVGEHGVDVFPPPCAMAAAAAPERRRPCAQAPRARCRSPEPAARRVRAAASSCRSRTGPWRDVPAVGAQ